jgi:regulator of replication initiation timing
MKDWKNMSNTEIRVKMSSMELEYDAIKNKINNLVSELDRLDMEYNNAKKELENRLKK